MAFVTPLAVGCSSFSRTLPHKPASAPAPAPRIRVAAKRHARMTIPSTETTQSSTPPAASFDFLNNWYPVAWTADVVPLRPITVTILTRNYVIYYDRPNKTYVALDDICPHRCAPLSEGRLYERNNNTETILECGYHGWRFNTCGKCVDIPVVPLSKPIPSAANVKGVYPTAVRLGLIFVWLGEPHLADENLIPIPKKVLAENENDLALTRTMKRTFPIPFAGVLENLADPAHVHFAHHGTMEGNRKRVHREMRMEIVERDHEAGRVQSAVFLKEVPFALYNVHFEAPVSMHYDVTVPPRRTPTEKMFLLLTWVVPRNASSCDVYATYVHKRGRLYKFLLSLIPRWVQHISGNMILDGDASMIGSVEKRLEGSRWQDKYVLASGSWDTLVVEVRRWMDKYAPEWLRGRGSEVDKTVLNDRLRWHVRECVSCSGALKNMLRGRIGVWVALGVCVATSLFGAILFAVCTQGGIPFDVGRLKAITTGATIMAALLVAVAVQLERLIRLLTYSDVAEKARLAS